MRNWIPASSAAIAMAPPKASTSLTRCPFPIPPIDGLHDICPSVSMLWVNRRVRQPARAATSAASVPAWPPPTTMTSNWVGNCIVLGRKIGRIDRILKGFRDERQCFTWNFRRVGTDPVDHRIKGRGNLRRADVSRETSAFEQTFHRNYTACWLVNLQVANRVSTGYSQPLRQGDRLE